MATAESPATTSSTLDAVYEENMPLLVGVAIKEFSISEAEAETLAHDVFLSYLLKASEVRDTRRWLVSAIYNASKAYLRSRRRLMPLPDSHCELVDPSSARVREMLPDQLAAREAFCCLTERCQLALRLRYLEGYSVPEVAVELRTSDKYAQKLIGKCLNQAHRRYTEKGRRP